MTAPEIADRLRAVAASLEPAFGLEADDPDLLELKLILLARATVLEAEVGFQLSRVHETKEV